MQLTKIQSNCDQRRMLLRAVEMVGIFLWLSNLIRTDAYFSVYCLCGIAAVWCMAADKGRMQKLPKKVFWSALVLGMVFALAVVLANYPIFQRVRDPATVSAGSNRMMNMVEVLATFLGGIPVCFQLLRKLYFRAVEGSRESVRRCSGEHPVRFFLIAFGVIVVIDLIYLFFVDYPGNISHDSLRQITQTYTGVYDNRLPYW